MSAAEADGKKRGKVELSRKERIKLKKEAKRQERKADSDDEDLAADAPAFKVSHSCAKVHICTDLCPTMTFVHPASSYYGACSSQSLHQQSS